MKENIKGIIFLILVISFTSCNDDKESLPKIDYKQKMRDFVKNISSYAKEINPNFAIIPQNGIELISTTGDDKGYPQIDYINAIDGIGQESLNYGYYNDDKKTPNEDNKWIRYFLDLAKNNSAVKIMVTDYCSTLYKIEKSYYINNSNSYISFTANHRELDNIPNYPTTIYGENSNIITNLQQVKNFLYLINPDEQFKSKKVFIDAIKNTNYDCIIMDFFHNGDKFTTQEIEELKQKANGGKRLLICYMSIGESENYRYYWQSSWGVGNPSFIEKENPNWRGNYVVRYWESEWQDIIFGNENSYLKMILDSGFNGVYLDIVDAFEEFEN